MKKYDFETRNKISIVIGLLCVFDEEVVNESDYFLIKNNNINNSNDLEFVSDVLLKSWFLEYTSKNRDKVITSINFIISRGNELVNIVFKEVFFIFDYEIEDKLLFLTRIKNILEEYVNKNE